jgi:hypothetical protein
MTRAGRDAGHDVVTDALDRPQVRGGNATERALGAGMAGEDRVVSGEVHECESGAVDRHRVDQFGRAAGCGAVEAGGGSVASAPTTRRCGRICAIAVRSSSCALVSAAIAGSP